MNTALRPSLRPLAHPSLSSISGSSTYICQPCRHARLLRRPKRPYTFTQLVTLSDGSAFTMRTTSPLPVYRSTRDTRNAPLWNPSSQDLQNVEEDEAGRLAGFRARFGKGFDSSKAPVTVEAAAEKEEQPKPESTPTSSPKLQAAAPKSMKTAPVEQDEMEGLWDAEDDASLLDLISSFGQDESKIQPWQMGKEKKVKGKGK